MICRRHKLAPQRPLSSPFPCTPPRLNLREGKILELWPRQVLKLSCPCKKGCALHFNKILLSELLQLLKMPGCYVVHWSVSRWFADMNQRNRGNNECMWWVWSLDISVHWSFLKDTHYLTWNVYPAELERMVNISRAVNYKQWMCKSFTAPTLTVQYVDACSFSWWDE